jgi:hypothetical protein
MKSKRHHSFYVGPLSVLLAVFAASGAKAQETGHEVCRSIGGFTPEQLGDRENHALFMSQGSCEETEGLLAGAVENETGVVEWDGPHAKELSGFGIVRKPGATIAFQDLDGQVELTMTDGKPTGWTAKGHSVVTLATGPWSSRLGRTSSWTVKSTGANTYETNYTMDIK